LKGEGPEDLTELSLTLGSQMVVLGKKASSIDEAREMLKENIKNGKALEKFKQFLSSQGGDETVVDQLEHLPKAKYEIELKAKQSGYISSIVAENIGRSAMLLGAGRQTKESVIDLAVGIMLNKKVGDYVEAGESLLTIHSQTKQIESIKQSLYNDITISETKVESPQLIKKIIQ